MSLKISDSDRAKLEKKHEEEMKKDVTDGDLEDEEECDVADDAQNDDKDDQCSEGIRKLSSRTLAVRNATRKKMVVVQKAHDEWSKKDKGKGAKRGMLSLIPRLLSSQAEEGKEGMEAESKRPPKTSSETSSKDSSSDIRHALSLDHDYFSKGADDFAVEKITDEVHEAAPEQIVEKPSTSSVEDVEGSSADEDKTRSSEDGSETLKVQKPPKKKSDSFFTWLAMCGIISQGCSRKPQAIHEDMVIQRCSIHMDPTPKLLSILSKNLTPRSDPCSTPSLAREKPEGSRSRNSQGPFQTLGELVNAPYVPFQPLHVADWEYELCPEEQYIIKDLHKSLDQVCLR